MNPQPSTQSRRTGRRSSGRPLAGRHWSGVRLGAAVLAMAAASAAAPAANELLDDTTIALFDFRTGDEQGLVDRCGKGTLQLEGDAPAALAPGSGILLDGTTRLLGYLPPLAAPFTIEALIRLDGDSPGTIHGIFEQFNYLVNGCRMGVTGYSGNRLSFEISDPKARTMVHVAGKTSLQRGRWYHVAVTYDGKAERLWVNGREDGSREWAGGIVAAKGPVMVGYESGPKYFFVGAIAYLRISGVARTAFPHGEQPVGPAAGPVTTVTARYPDVSAYFFPADRPFDVTCTVRNQGPAEARYSVGIAATLHGGGATKVGPVAVVVPPAGQCEVTIPVSLTTRGLYLPTLVVESGGAELQRRKLPAFAIVEPLPPLAEVPATSHFGGQPTVHMPGSERIGMKWNRFWDYPTNWAAMEPERGKYNWEPTDRLLAGAMAKGEEVVWCLCFTPGWASAIPDRAVALADPVLKGMYRDGLAELYDSGHLAYQYPPRDIADWKSYVARTVTRYKDRVKYWEVWNEANSGHFIGTPAQYCELLKTAYETIKQLDPTATVVGIAGCPGWLRFTEEVFKLGGLQFMDVLSYHDYAYAVPETFGCDQKVAQTRELMRRYGRVLPMWDTEVGFPQPPRVAGRPMSGDEFRANLELTAAGKPPDAFFARCITSRRGTAIDATYGAIWPTTEDRAARYLVRQFVLEMSEGMEKFNVHAGAPISRGKLPLLPGISHAMMARALGTATFVRRVATPSPSLRVYLFRAEAGTGGAARTLAVAWTTQPSEQAVLLTERRRIPTADLYGNPGEVTGDGRQVLLPLTEAPTYLLDVPADLEVWNPLEAQAPGVVAAGESFRVQVAVTNTLPGTMDCTVRVAGLPSGWRAQPDTLPVQLAGGARTTGEFTVTVPAEAPRGQAAVSVAVQAGAMTCSRALPLVVIRPTPCPPAPAAARVDGDLSEWTAPPALIDAATRVVVGKPSPMFDKLPGTWWGPEDLSARLWVGWTEGALLEALDVTDDSLTPRTNMRQAYMADCVELFVDGRALARQVHTGYERGVAQLLLSPPAADGKCRLDMCQGDVTGTVAVGKRTPRGYTVEARIPLAAPGFPDFVAAPGATLGFDVAIDDADQGGEREVQMVWQGSAQNCQDTSLFARLRF